VARQLVVYHRRAGGQSQFSALLELEPKSDRIQSALANAKRNLDKPLTVRQLAAAAQQHQHDEAELDDKIGGSYFELHRGREVGALAED
jgi:hypothetical protein